MPQAVLFDLDDTIIAWDAVADQSWKAVCSRMAAQNRGLDGDKLCFSIKEARDWYLADPERHRWSRLNLEEYRREVSSLGLTHLGVNIPGLDRQIGRAYGVEREAAAYVLPGAIDKLKGLRDNGVRLALVTNGSGDVQRRKIERFQLGRFHTEVKKYWPT